MSVCTLCSQSFAETMRVAGSRARRELKSLDECRIGDVSVLPCSHGLNLPTRCVSSEKVNGKDRNALCGQEWFGSATDSALVIDVRQNELMTCNLRPVPSHFDIM